jgi:outer membrane protein assembly factor BamB
MIAAARRGAAIVGVGVGFAVTGMPSTTARAQRVDPERPRTFVVGLPAGARMDRVDGARTGRSLTLPRSALFVGWRVALGTYVDRGPVVDARGGSYVVSIRGEVIALGADGVERWRVATGAGQPGPAVLLSDDTVVFADASGQAVAVRDGAVRWRLRFGAADVDAPSPLPLEDGGVVVATTRELALVDSEGNERAHARLPEPVMGPLLWSAGRVIAVATGGSVWRWTPGTAQPERVGAFGAPIDSGAALADDRTLIAVAPRDSTLRTLDLTHGGTTALRATSSRGQWRGPPAVVDGLALLIAFGSGGEQAVAIDASGEEIERATLATRGSPGPQASVDAGGPQPLVAGPTPPLVDASGTLAFATSNGAVGVALFAPSASNRSLDGATPVTVEVVPDVCPLAFAMTTGASTSAPRAVAGLAALPGKRILAVCRSGAVLALTG